MKKIPFVLMSLTALTTILMGACGGRSSNESPRLSIHQIERIDQKTVDLSDQLDIAPESSKGSAQFADLVSAYIAGRARLERALSMDPLDSMTQDDSRALRMMRRAFEEELVPIEALKLSPVDEHVTERNRVDCHYDAEALAMKGDGYRALRRRIFECYKRAARSLTFEGDQVDDLTVWSQLPLIDEPERRELLWRSMMPMWKSFDGYTGSPSPYQLFVQMNAARMKESGEEIGESVRGIGVDPELMERWLVRVLEKWREIAPNTTMEPWDFLYLAGSAHRQLIDDIPLESLRALNDRFYRDLGADPVTLGVQYDLEPGPDKEPFAHATYGRRPRYENDRWVVGQTWVIASYGKGGLDNLFEILHETGHAIQLAAIRTRPAFTDMPDSEIFVEGVANIAALEIYEPAWQRRYLGRSVPVKDANVAKYTYIVMEVATGLFELRMYRDPERDPDELSSEICDRYFRVRPHTELAWWGVWPQLITSPGYMMNYAAGAIMVADLRVRTHEVCGPYTEGNTSWYGSVSEHLYRFGFERPSKEVIEDFLGRPVSLQAILDDMDRARVTAP